MLDLSIGGPWRRWYSGACLPDHGSELTAVTSALVHDLLCYPRQNAIYKTEIGMVVPCQISSLRSDAPPKSVPTVGSGWPSQSV
jgi:hypothetical protein